MRGLTGKRILVDGSASGIGAATAKRLREEGAQLFLGDINEDGVQKVADEITAAEFKAAMLAGVTVPRLGRPEDLASTIAFLLSDDTAWVSGQVWSVNGGGGFRD